MELQLKNFKESLINVVNESGLPLVLVSYTVKEILSEVEELRARQLQQEMAEQQPEVEKVEAEIVE